MQVNTAAAATVTITAGATIVAAVAAASVASTVQMVVYAILAITLSAVSIASITAWINTEEEDVGKYFDAVGAHLKFAIAGVYTFVAQTLVQAIVQGIAQGVGTAIRRKIAGPDVTHREERRELI